MGLEFIRMSNSQDETGWVRHSWEEALMSVRVARNGAAEWVDAREMGAMVKNHPPPSARGLGSVWG